MKTERPTEKDLEFLRQTYPRATNSTIAMLLDEIALLKKELAAERLVRVLAADPDGVHGREGPYIYMKDQTAAESFRKLSEEAKEGD